MEIGNDVNTELFHQLKKAQIVDDKFLKFAEPINLKDRPLKGLYIRSCYLKLLSFINSSIHNHQRPSVLILGDPGVGKTFFSYYLIQKLIAAKQNIVYEKAENKRIIYVYESAQVKQYVMNNDASECEVDRLLRSASTWYVIDGCEPKLFRLDLHARIVLLSSLKKRNYFNYEKLFLVNRYYIPRWSFDELNVCKNVFFDAISDETLTSLYEKFGPSPKYLIDRVNLKSIHSVLDESINRFDLDYAILNNGELDEFEMISDVIHLNVDEESLQNKGITFASSHIARRVIEKHLAYHDELFKRSIRLSINSKYFLDLKSLLFQFYAIDRLAKGGHFKLLDLHSNEENIISMPSREKREFSTIDDILGEEEGYKYLWTNEKATTSLNGFAGIILPDYFIKFNSDLDDELVNLIRCFYTAKNKSFTRMQINTIELTYLESQILMDRDEIDNTEIDLNDINDKKILCFRYAILIEI